MIFVVVVVNEESRGLKVPPIKEISDLSVDLISSLRSWGLLLSPCPMHGCEAQAGAHILRL